MAYLVASALRREEVFYNVIKNCERIVPHATLFGWLWACSEFRSTRYATPAEACSTANATRYATRSLKQTPPKEPNEMSQANQKHGINRITHQLTQIDDPDAINEATLTTAAATLSAAPYTRARATSIGSCGRVSFGRSRRNMPGIAVFVPDEVFGLFDAEHAVLHGFDGEARDQPWSDQPVSEDDLSTLANPADSAEAAADVIDKWAASDDLNTAGALSWANSPLIAVIKHAADRSSMPDVAVWHGTLTETGRACFGRERKGESGFAVFVPTCSLWDEEEHVIEAIDEPWW